MPDGCEKDLGPPARARGVLALGTICHDIPSGNLNRSMLTALPNNDDGNADNRSSKHFGDSVQLSLNLNTMSY
jgi:hypothetical protein